MGSFLIVFSVLVAQYGLGSAQSLIQFPSIKYVKPGASFDLVCQTDNAGIVDAIYAPNEDVPSDAELRESSLQKTDNAFTHATGSYIKNYEDASKAEHAGLYTCAVFHRTEPVVVQATCLVIIEDLCEDVVCLELKTCVGDYDAGISECQCVFDCQIYGLTLAGHICTDTCETMAHECEMQERNCLDGGDRKVWRTGGLCPWPYGKAPKPDVRQLGSTQQIEPEVGEQVTLDCGIVLDGVPPAEVTWTVDGVEKPEFKNQHQYVFTAIYDMGTFMECKIVHCRKESNAISNRWFILSDDKPSTEPPDIGGDETPTPRYPVCSVFPGGTIEQFDSAAKYYDLACSHLLAADFSPGGDYTQGWYIYGTFDQHEENTALSAMTIFVGNTAFEFQRGWLINMDGEKFEVEEGIARTVGDCEVTFIGLHLKATCPHFHAYYDGLMSGHVQIGNSPTSSSSENPLVASLTVIFHPRKGHSNLGLCWDNQSGFRPNWQVVSRSGCTVDVSLEKCQNSSACDRFILPPYTHFPLVSLGLGAHQSCNELHCEGKAPTAAQGCALNQADAVNRKLRDTVELTGAVDVEGCPEGECDWKLDLLSRGCPQDNPPFEC